MNSNNAVDAGYIVIFRPWITTRDGRRIYPRHGKVFCLKIRSEK